MKLTRRLLLGLGLGLGLGLAGCATGPQSLSETAAAFKALPIDAAPTQYPGYTLVWHDEFNENGPPDPKNWNFEHGFVRNHELQWYQLENAWCENGLLIIEGRREEKPNPNYSATVPATNWQRSRQNIEYTAASLGTRGLHSFQYGRFEMRGRIDIDPGMWPAFWTLGLSGGWPANGEVDIMEFYQGRVLANFGWAGPSGRAPAIWNSVRTPVANFGDPDWAKKFHVWRMDWDENSMKIYIDDKLVNTQDFAKVYNQGPTPTKNPYLQPEYILLNLAIGGDQGGDPSATKFPARYEVDYVRVYQKTADAVALDGLKP